MSNVTKPIILNETGEQIVQKLSEIASSNKSFELLLDTKADKTSVSTPYNFKGSTTYDALPTSNNNVNDTYYCTDVKCKYTWNGSGWFQSSLSEVDYTDEISKLSDEIGNKITPYRSTFFKYNNFNLAQNVRPLKYGAYVDNNGVVRSNENYVNITLAVDGNTSYIVNNISARFFITWYTDNTVLSGNSTLENESLFASPENANKAIISFVVADIENIFFGKTDLYRANPIPKINNDFVEFESIIFDKVIDVSNYGSILPSLDDAKDNLYYFLNFANGSTDIPLNYPNGISYNGSVNILYTVPILYANTIMLKRQFLYTDEATYTRVYNSNVGWTKWNKTESKKYITVSKSVNADYSVLKDAIAYAYSVGNCTVHILDGRYDLVEEFGQEYFDNLSDTLGDGLIIGKGVEIICDNAVEVVCDYQGDNENVNLYFSIWHVDYNNPGFSLIGGYHHGSGIRYVVHDDPGGYKKPYDTIIKKTEMFIDNSNSGTNNNAICIGGGLGVYGNILIENNIVDAVPTGIEKLERPISYHTSSVDNNYGNVEIVGNYVKRGTIGALWYGDYTEHKAKFLIRNNRVTETIKYAQSNAGGSNNIDLYAFGNVIES